MNFIIVKVPIVDKGCKVDADCPSKEACFNRKCDNPCVVIRPCAANAICTVHNEVPWRTMSCKCKEGYKGTGKDYCEKISKSNINIK